MLLTTCKLKENTNIQAIQYINTHNKGQSSFKVAAFVCLVTTMYLKVFSFRNLVRVIICLCTDTHCEKSNDLFELQRYTNKNKLLGTLISTWLI